MSVESDLQSRRLVGHLLRRAGFGASQDEIARRASKPYEAIVEELLHPERTPDHMDELFIRHYPEHADLTDPPDGAIWWAYRMLHSQNPLQEKMALFWHDHFACSFVKVKPPYLLFRQYEKFRQLGLADFAYLARAIARDPAMVLYLDNNTNRKDAPNENFGRELLELFTLGKGNYTEDDVKAAARAFTGWSTAGRGGGGGFRFEAYQHDEGLKTFMGRTGDFGGYDIVNHVVDHPATAKSLATKLYLYFVADTPDEAAIVRIAQSYRSHSRDMRAVLRDLFLSDYFRDPKCWHAKVKNPPEFVIGVLKTLGDDPHPRQIAMPMKDMGMELFNPPNVAGWDWGASWIDTSLLLERINFVSELMEQRRLDHPGLGALVNSLMGYSGTPSAEQLVQALLQWIGPLDVSPEARRDLVDFARGEFAGAARSRQGGMASSLAKVVQAAMALPEYQMA